MYLHKVLSFIFFALFILIPLFIFLFSLTLFHTLSLLCFVNLTSVNIILYVVTCAFFHISFFLSYFLVFILLKMLSHTEYIQLSFLFQFCSAFSKCLAHKKQLSIVKLLNIIHFTLSNLLDCFCTHYIFLLLRVSFLPFQFD